MPSAIVSKIGVAAGCFWDAVKLGGQVGLSQLEQRCPVFRKVDGLSSRKQTIELPATAWPDNISYWSHGVGLLQHNLTVFDQFLRSSSAGLDGAHAVLDESNVDQRALLEELDVALEAWILHDGHRKRRVTCSKDLVFRDHPTRTIPTPANHYHVDFESGLHSMRKPMPLYEPLRQTNQDVFELDDFFNIWLLLNDVVRNYHLSFIYLTDKDRFAWKGDYQGESSLQNATVFFLPRMQRYQAFVFRSAAAVPSEAPVHGTCGWKELEDGKAARISFETRCSVWRQREDSNEEL